MTGAGVDHLVVLDGVRVVPYHLRVLSIVDLAGATSCGRDVPVSAGRGAAEGNCWSLCGHEYRAGLFDR